MSVTRPSFSSKLTRSPIRNGCEIAICTPATRLPIVCWAAKPTTSPSTAVEARMPPASRFSSVNWLSAIIARTKRTMAKTSRRRKRRRVWVERETCETAGVMEANLAVEGVGRQPRRFPYSNWGPWVALLGVFLALGTGVVMGIPAAIIGHKDDGDLTTFGNVGVQLATAIGFLLVPMAIAAQRGAATMREVLRRLGLRRFRPSTGLKWTAAAIGAYLLFALLYSSLVVEPKQEDIADGFGPL